MAGSPAQVLSAYYAAAVRRSIAMPAINVSSGNSYALPLPHAGVGLYVDLAFVGTASNTAGATVTTINLGEEYPYSVISDLSFRDYTGITRISGVNGFHLARREQIERGAMYGNKFLPYSNTQWDLFTGYNNYSSLAYTATAPAVTASSTTTAPLVFHTHVPLSVNRRSVLGSMPYTVPQGDNVITFSIAPAVSMPAVASNPSPDTPINVTYTAGASDTVSFSGQIIPTYYYYDVPSGTALPVDQFAEVFELVKLRTTENINAGSPLTFVLATGRTYRRVYEWLSLAGQLATSQAGAFAVTNVQFQVDSATPTLNEGINAFLSRTQDDMGVPPYPGEFVFDFARKPWTPDSYGSLNTQLQLSGAVTTGANTYLDVMRECLYTVAPNLAQTGAVG
ncbi:MAG: hypothetical protein ACYCT2_09040 [Thermoplasmataceae archaeon]